MQEIKSIEFANSVAAIDTGGLAGFLREQCLWEINGVHQLVYSGGLGNRLAILQETTIRDTLDSSTGLFQLKCVAKHLIDAVLVYAPNTGKQLNAELRDKEFLYSAHWLDRAVKAFEQADLVETQSKFDTAISFTMGNGELTLYTTVGGRLRWFTLPSITFHKMLVYGALRRNGMRRLGKIQAFGYSQKTSISNNQIDWKSK